MLATPGTAIERAALLALAQRAEDIGCTGVYGDYPFHPVGGEDAPHWLTDLTNLHRDVVWKVGEQCSVFVEGTPLDPTIATVSGPWMVPPGHPAFFSNGVATLNGIWVGSQPNLGRSALGVKLWSRREATPFRVVGRIAPAFDYMLLPADDNTGYTGANQTEGTATWTFSRPTKCAGFVRVVVEASRVSDPRDVGVTWTGCSTAPDNVEEIFRTETDNGDGTWDVSAQYHGEWGTCNNPSGNRDDFDPDGSDPDAASAAEWTVSFQITGGGYMPAQYSTDHVGFNFSARYGEAGDYAAEQKPAVSNDVWYVTHEDPALTVTSPVRKTGLSGTGPSTNYSNVAGMQAEPLPADAENPAETWWEAKLWPVGWMRRSNSYAFPAQAEPSGGQTVAVPLRASDGLWVQSDQVAEVQMDGVERDGVVRLQPTATVVGGAEPCPVAIDFVSLTRREPYGAKPEISVDLKCWRGTGGSRALVTLGNVKLRAGEIHRRVNLDELLPVFDSISIAHSNADLVTVRLGNWKAIGQYWWSIPGPPHILYAVGQISPEGIPADLVNDLARVCDAIDPP